MKKAITILLSILALLIIWESAVGQVRINEIRADDEGTDDVEFVELAGITGTDITGYEIVHVNGSGGSTIFSHTIGSFTFPDDGITDNIANNLGFYVLGAGGFSTGTDESTNTALQNGADGIILYDDEGNVIDAVAWDGAGDINGDVTTSGSPSADNYLHVTSKDQANDNSLQAPNDVIGDDGSGWKVLSPTIGAINIEQSSGSVILTSSIKAEPENHLSSFTATGVINSVNLSWTDATGSPAPDGYLIKVSNIGFGSISDPTDGVTVSNDSNMSDDSGALNVNSGVESASFSGLNETTTYYFKIFPYTNTGSDIDYKTDGTIPQDDATTLDTPDIVLNEFLADPPDGSAGDANEDGTRSFDDDEFIEFVNTGSTNLDISEWVVNDGDDDRHTFPNPTVLSPNQAVVVFGGGTPIGGFGGSLVQTTTSLSLSNSSGQIILKNSSGSEIINYSYGSEANNDESLTRNPDLTGDFEDHTTADTDDNSFFSPGTRIDGSPFQSSEAFSVTLDDGEGWRMLSTPTSGNSYQDLLANIWTQCSENADYNGAGCDEANVLTYNGSDFVNAGDLDDADENSMIPGRGILVYVYSDADFNGTSEESKTLNLTGVPTSGNINAPLNSGDGTWTLTGNPYDEPIDWDELDTSDLHGTIYVYDYSYGTIDGGGDDVAEDENDVGGGYRTWNGDAGSLANGIITPFQGFWVQSSVTSPGLTFVESAQTTGGTFYSKENEGPVAIRLRSEMNNTFSEAFLSFTETGQLGEDRYDGLKLSPLDHRDYISLATEVEETQMDINNLPASLEEAVNIPLHVQAFEAIDSGWAQKGGEISLSWPELKNIPDSWEILLRDTHTGEILNLKEIDSYKFTALGSMQKIADKKPFNPFKPNPIQREKSPQVNRFILSINLGADDGNLQNSITEQFTLKQNYPNPFNPTTNIRYEIANPGQVELSVYNVMGQRITTLVNESQSPGAYEMTWDASDMASGIYYYRLKVGGMVFNRQMTLIK